MIESIKKHSFIGLPLICTAIALTAVSNTVALGALSGAVAAGIWRLLRQERRGSVPPESKEPGENSLVLLQDQLDSVEDHGTELTEALAYSVPAIVLTSAVISWWGLLPADDFLPFFALAVVSWLVPIARTHRFLAGRRVYRQLLAELRKADLEHRALAERTSDG